ncbi:hypothetical protein LINPERHAP1_LOCUS34994, partial [Linum perenne]
LIAGTPEFRENHRREFHRKETYQIEQRSFKVPQKVRTNKHRQIRKDSAKAFTRFGIKIMNCEPKSEK